MSKAGAADAVSCVENGDRSYTCLIDNGLWACSSDGKKLNCTTYTGSQNAKGVTLNAAPRMRDSGLTLKPDPTAKLPGCRDA